MIASVVRGAGALCLGLGSKCIRREIRPRVSRFPDAQTIRFSQDVPHWGVVFLPSNNNLQPQLSPGKDQWRTPTSLHLYVHKPVRINEYITTARSTGSGARARLPALLMLHPASVSER